MFVITGAAGFIGSCLVARLNELGYDQLILVDHYEDDNDSKRLNLKDKNYVRFYDKHEFLELINKDELSEQIDVCFHMGACSSTTGQDPDYYDKNNFEYSRDVANWCFKHKTRLIYASSAATYGEGELGYDDDHAMIPQLKPLNFYGQSKQKFDEWVLEHGYENQCAGLKFFNVFGPNEYHKGDMCSVIAKAYQRVRDEGKMSLFKSYRDEYKDGEQRRDFVYVKDVVEVMIFLLEHKDVNGIFNVGTGQSRTWNDVARSLFSATGIEPCIDYIDMPDILQEKYQYFTEAKMDKLKAAGYMRPFTSLEDSVKDYVSYLEHHSYY